MRGIDYNKRMSKQTIYDVAVLGAGAAGLMAAIAVRRSERGLTLALLEKNDKAGKKLYATGNGRCNLLNRTARAEDYRSGEATALSGKASEKTIAFAGAALDLCGPERLQKLFAELGLECREEEQGRLYPRSLQAASVVEALERGAFGSAGPGCPAEILYGFDARTAFRDGDVFRVEASDGRTVLCRRLILAGGGKAGIQYGCEGRPLKIAQSFGCRVIKPIPALTGLVCEEESLLRQLAGVRVRGRVRLLCRRAGECRDRLLGESEGEIQFNADSVSGICVMDVSRGFRTDGALGAGERFALQLDLFPECSGEELQTKLEDRKKVLGDYFLAALLPRKLADLAEKRCSDAEELSQLLKGMRFTPAASKGWKEAHTTSGGVALDEADPKTMASARVPGLYLAGEILDMDGPCGGYSLTWAFASGWIAGSAAAASLEGRTVETL